jgi:hypothetical protein
MFWHRLKAWPAPDGCILGSWQFTTVCMALELMHGRGVSWGAEVIVNDCAAYTLMPRDTGTHEGVRTPSASTPAVHTSPHKASVSTVCMHVLGLGLAACTSSRARRLACIKMRIIARSCCNHAAMR